MSFSASNQLLVGSVTLSLVAAITTQALATSLSPALLNLATLHHLIFPESLIKVAREIGEEIATASDSYVQATVTEAISEATLGVSEKLRDFYGYELSLGGNVTYFCLACVLLLFFIAMLFRSRYQMFNVCFIGAFGFETLGYLGRVLAVHNPSEVSFFVLQALRLIMVPQLLFASICIVFSQTVCAHGEKYSSLKPLRIFYLFVSLNWVSTLIAAIGEPLVLHIMDVGQMSKNCIIGMNFMFAGGVLNTVTLLCFIILCHIVSYNTFFNERFTISSDSKYRSPGVANYFKMLFNVRTARIYKREHLDRLYSPRYQGIRSRPLFYYYPLIIVVSATLLLIRSVYRVVGTKLGNVSYLHTHEALLFLIEEPSIIVVGLLFVPFHPLFVFGRDNVLRIVDMGQEEFSGAEMEGNMRRDSERGGERSVVPAPYTVQNRNEVLYIT